MGGATALPTLLNSPALLRSPLAVRAAGRALDLAEQPLETREIALGLLDKLSMHQLDTSMRFCAVEALGSLRHAGAAQVILRIAQKDSDGDVRATACHSLLRLLQAGVLDKSLETLLHAFLDLQGDTMDRYVAAYAAEGVHQVEYRMGQQREAQSQQQRNQMAATFVHWCSFGDGWACKK